MLHTIFKQSLFLTLMQLFWSEAREEEILHYPVPRNWYTGKEEIQKAPEEILHNPASSDRYTPREEIQKALGEIPHYPVSIDRYAIQEEFQKAPEEILHYPVSSGRYTVKEEIQKAPAENHFCNLTRTSVKISFPAMKSETFVKFLVYKEPN